MISTGCPARNRRRTRALWPGCWPGRPVPRSGARCCSTRQRRCTWRGGGGRWRRRWLEVGMRWIAGLRPRCSSDCEPQPRRSVLPDDSYNHALDEDISLLEAHGLHGRIGRLQSDPAAGLAVELLHGGLAAVDQGDNHLAVLGRLLTVDHHDVAVDDMLVDHRGALHLQGVIRAAPREHLLRYGDAFLMHQGFDRSAGGDFAQQGDFAGGRGAPRWEYLDGTALVVGAADIALALQVGEMLVDCCQRLKPEMLGDFLEAGGVALTIDVSL